MRQVVVHKDREQGDLEEQLDIIMECERLAVSTWQRMAKAVKAIYDGKLWQQGGHKSFEACMSSSLGWQKSHAYRLVHAGDVLEVVPITSIRQAEVLHSLSDEKKVEVWRKATEGGRTPTEKALEGALGRPAAKEPLEPPERPAAPEAVQAAPAHPVEEQAKQDDGAGMFAGIEPAAQDDAIPPDCTEYDRLVRDVGAIRARLDAMAKTRAGAFMSGTEIRHGMDGVIGLLRWARPAAICPHCLGDESERCEQCDDRRWVSKGRLDTISKAMARRKA